MIGDLDSPMACDFLTRWDSLEAVQRSRKDSIRDFYRKHNSRSKELIEARVAIIASSMPLTKDEAWNRCGKIETGVLVGIIRALVEARTELDGQIAKIYEEHPERSIIDSFTGVGPVFGPRLAALLGTNRTRYTSREDLQRVTGIAPVTRQTGGKKRPKRSVERRRSRPKFIHQTIIEWTATSLSGSPWAKATYEIRRAEGSSHYEALRAVGFKWLRILYYCWANQVEYSEEHHQEELKKRRSRVAAGLAA
jgi:hypothetical protein